MTDHAELIERLRGVSSAMFDWAEDFRRVGSIDGERSEKSRAELLKSAADTIAAVVAERDALAAEVARTREVASNADRAVRFVKLVASQRLSGAAIRWYEDEYGDDGEPDFIGAYDGFIQQARNIVDDAERARAALAQGGET